MARRGRDPDVTRRAVASGLAATLALAPFRAVGGESSPVGLPVWDGGGKPAFALDDLDGREVALGSQAGRIVLVHFFATWCAPCLVEIPALRRLVDRSDPADFRVLALSVGEVDVRVRNFAERMRINFPVLLDRDRSVARSWGVYALPTSYILGPDLEPRYAIERDHDWDSLDLRALRDALSANRDRAGRRSGKPR